MNKLFVLPTLSALSLFAVSLSGSNVKAVFEIEKLEDAKQNHMVAKQNFKANPTSENLHNEFLTAKFTFKGTKALSGAVKASNAAKTDEDTLSYLQKREDHLNKRIKSATRRNLKDKLQKLEDDLTNVKAALKNPELRKTYLNVRIAAASERVKHMEEKLSIH